MNQTPKRRPALFACIAYISGIVLGNHFNLSVILLAVFSMLGLALSFVFLILRRYPLSTLSVIFTLTIAGFLNHDLKTEVFPPNHIKSFLNSKSPVTISGNVVKDPDIRKDKTFLTIQTKSLIKGEKIHLTSGKILLKIRKPTNLFNYGDFIRFRGFLYQPSPPKNPKDFDYRKYLARKDIFALTNLRTPEYIKILYREDENLFLSKIVLPTKHFILKVFNSHLKDPHRALLAGFVLGEKRGIPQDIYRMFTDTGTLHLLAISGSNVGLVVLFCFYFFLVLRIPRKPSFILTIPAVVIFSYITNNEPSVVRASVMAICFLFAFYLEKEREAVNILAFSALLILLFSPLSLFDVGFQLSYAATAGILLLIVNPKSLLFQLAERFKGDLKNWIILPSLVSLAATLSTYPIIAYYFNRISIYTFLANLIMVPLVSLAVITGSVTVLASLLSFSLSGILSAFNWLCLSSTLWTVNFFSNLPCSTVMVNSPTYFFLILFYLFVFLSLAGWKNITTRRAGFLVLSVLLFYLFLELFFI
ncbi:MAG: hypothetical protein AMJ90_08005 [candidate division Zixibacteria bacterium SM23_73_2]|nr:MAG: hypothetical protein AMJ90_08005 [candidate division Zixibacteria bacterium SM23_73_2]